MKNIIDELMSSKEFEEAVNQTTQEHIDIKWNPLKTLSNKQLKGGAMDNVFKEGMKEFFGGLMSDIVWDFGNECITKSLI